MTLIFGFRPCVLWMLCNINECDPCEYSLHVQSFTSYRRVLSPVFSGIHTGLQIDICVGALKSLCHADAMD